MFFGIIIATIILIIIGIITLIITFLSTSISINKNQNTSTYKGTKGSNIPLDDQIKGQVGENIVSRKLEQISRI